MNLQKLILMVPLNGWTIVCQFLTAMVLSRGLGASEYGLYVYYFSVAAITSIFVGVGMDQFWIREIPKLKLGKVFKSQFDLFIHIIIVFFLGGVLAFLILNAINLFDVRFSILLISIVIGLAFMMPIKNLFISILQMHNKLVLPQVVFRMIAPTIFLILSALFIYGNLLDNFMQFLVVNIFVDVAVLIILFLLYESFTFRYNGAAEISVAKFMSVFKGGLPIGVVSVTYLLNSNIDIIMAGAFLTDADVAIYRIASRGALIVGLVSVVSNQVLVPKMSQLIAENKEKETQIFFSCSALVLFLGGIIASFFIFYFAHFFLLLFGEEFVVGVSVLRILVAVLLFDVTTSLLAPFIVFKKSMKFIVYVNIIGVFVNVVFNFILVNEYKLIGVAIATAFSLVFIRISLMWKCYTDNNLKLFKLKDVQKFQAFLTQLK